jgi:hypothetical protein
MKKFLINFIFLIFLLSGFFICNFVYAADITIDADSKKIRKIKLIKNFFMPSSYWLIQAEKITNKSETKSRGFNRDFPIVTLPAISLIKLYQTIFH